MAYHNKYIQDRQLNAYQTHKLQQLQNYQYKIVRKQSSVQTQNQNSIYGISKCPVCLVCINISIADTQVVQKKNGTTKKLQKFGTKTNKTSRILGERNIII